MLPFFFLQENLGDIISFLVHHIMSYTISVSLIIANIISNYVVKVASAMFLYYRVTIFASVVNKQFVEMYFETM